MRKFVVSLVLVSLGSLIFIPVLHAENSEVFARVRIVSCLDPGRTIGSALMRERPSPEGVKEVDVTIRMFKGTLSPGKHAVHIHEAGICQPCADAGGHFDPGPESNPSPDGNHPYHAGDLINIYVPENGRSISFVTTSRITLSPGPLSVFDENGSSIIIHDNPDTYCPDGEAAGCAGGSRAACGIIRRR